MLGLRLVAQLSAAMMCHDIPADIDAYHLIQTKAMADSADGVAYRFVTSVPELVTVFLYPIPTDVRAGADTAAWIKAEAEKFTRLLPAGVKRGWYDVYAVAFESPDTIQLSNRPATGFLSGATTKRGNKVSVELQYLYPVCGKFVKVRGTLDSDTWGDSKFPLFAKHLIKFLSEP